MGIATLALLVFTAAVSQAALGASSCSVSDIEVRRMNWRIMGGSGLNADGELVNRYAEPIGAQIKILKLTSLVVPKSYEHAAVAVIRLF